MTWEEYGQQTRHEIVRNMASILKGEIIELGANYSNYIIKNSKKLDIKNADCVHDLNKGLPFKNNSVDNIIACEIIEHMHSPYSFLAEIKRVLKRGGVLILTTPNICCLKNRIKIFLGRFPINVAMADFYRHWVDDDNIAQNAHYSDYSIPYIEYALKKQGFEIINKKSNGIYFHAKKVLPLSLTPATFGENMIIKARLR